MAWEGALDWDWVCEAGRKYKELAYEASIAVVYRDMHRNEEGSDITNIPLDFVIVPSFSYRCHIFPFVYIFYPPGVVLLIMLCVCQITGAKHIVRNSN
jgi:hypothetical protein